MEAPKQETLDKYRTRANKGRSILEAALEYRPQKQGVKNYFLNRVRSQTQAALFS